MLSIKLARYGKKHHPIYRIVVIDSRKVATGAYLEVIGHYNPETEPSTVDMNHTRYDFWVKRGAQPSNTVKKLAQVTAAAPAAAEAAPEAKAAKPAAKAKAPAAKKKAPAKKAE
jgi:small subunit ribosomal protein S16